MRFSPTEIPGAYVIESEPVADPRGSFTRLWCSRELAGRGAIDRLAQASLSVNRAPGTLRGMHFQRPPHEEAKVVRCLRGAVFDVIVDLRPGPTRCRWVGVDLAADSERMLYVPPGVAHGFVTLAPDTEVLYFISEFYEPASAAGVRFDDPAFGIQWPVPVNVISDRDAGYPDFQP